MKAARDGGAPPEGPFDPGFAPAEDIDGDLFEELWLILDDAQEVDVKFANS